VVFVRQLVRALRVGIPLPRLRVHIDHAGVLQEVDQDPLDVVMDDGPQSGKVGAHVPVSGY
jgi:hypothetical protein